MITHTLRDVAFLAWVSVPSAPVDKDSQLDDDGGAAFRDTGSRNWISSSWVTGSAYALHQIKMRLGRFGTTTGTVRAHIYATVDTPTVGTPTGASLGASSTVDVSTLSNVGYPNGSTDVDFNFVTPISLSSGVQYAIALECPTFSGVAVTVRRDSVTGPSMICSTDGATWGSFTYTGARFYFKALGI
jgi:hypothetical protein